MKRSSYGFVNTIRYVCTVAVFCVGLLSIVGSGGGGSGGGGSDNGSGGNGTVQYTLTVNTVGQGSVSVDPSGSTYDEGTSVTLTATPESGWAFTGWSGGLSGTNATETITMDADKTVTATFDDVAAQDTEAPSWAGAALGAEGIGPTFLTLTWDGAADNVGVTAYRIFRDSGMEDTVPGDKTSYAVTGLSRDTEYTFRVEAGDAAGNWSDDISKDVTTDADLPQDPQDTAPELSASAAPSMSEASAFLYTGSDAVQKGVEPGAIKDWRVAVIRGRVVDENGQAIPEVTVSILGLPELGRTTTRADGAYDLAVNGGGLMKVHFDKEGLLPVKRELHVPWHNYVRIDDVVMIPRDSNVRTVQLNAGAAQAAQGSQVTDADGTRQATLVVPQAVSGELVMPDGTRQALSTMNFRVTEFTVGDEGPSRMPAEMPANIAYTYAMDLSIDEAQAAGAEDVEFDKPFYYYVENFLGFPAGIKVPTGYYDEERGVWVASESGLVIKIIDNTGTTVTVDTDGDDSADDAQTLADLGFTDQELAKLAELYAAGDTLWRVPLSHFSSWDCNFGAWPPEDAEIPWFKPDKKHRPDPCKSAGSIIDTSNMALGETAALAGLPFDLHYHSNRVPGYANTREIILRDENAPTSLQGIKLELEVAGQDYKFDFDADPDPSTDVDSYFFTWDGKDGYGRDVQGSVPMIVKVGYVYDGVYEPNDRWGEPGDVDATEIGDVSTRQQIGLWNTWTIPIGGLDPRAQGFGGWSLAIHHFYNPATEILYCGDGRQRSAEEFDPIIMTAAGTGEEPSSMTTWSGDGMKATEVDLGLYTADIDMGPDGSLYIAEKTFGIWGILRVTPDGIINRVAGGGMDNATEGISALEAIVVPIAVAVGPDETIYISEGARIRKVGPEGRINTIAGDGDQDYGPEGGPALGADFWAADIAVAPDGNLYLLDNDACVIRKVGTDGLLTTFAGTAGVYGTYTGEGGRARTATFSLPYAIDLGPDGSLYVADHGAHRVLRIDTRGIITTATGVPPFQQTCLCLPRSRWVLIMWSISAAEMHCAG